MSGPSQVPLTETELADLYKTGMENDFSNLERFLSELKANVVPSSEILEQAQSIVHNIKGQGASFGFPLMTEIGQSFYSLLRHQVELAEIHPTTIKLYEAHLTAMKSIIANEIRGEGPELLQKVAASLQEKVDVVIQ